MSTSISDSRERWGRSGAPVVLVTQHPSAMLVAHDPSGNDQKTKELMLMNVIFNYKRKLLPVHLEISKCMSIESASSVVVDFSSSRLQGLSCQHKFGK